MLLAKPINLYDLSLGSAALRDTSFYLSPASLEGAEAQRGLISEREIKQRALKSVLLIFLAKPTQLFSFSAISAPLRETCFFYLSPASLEDAETQSFGPVKFAMLVPVGNFTA